MLANQLALKYAQAIYEVAADKNLLSEVEEQLTTVEQAIREHEDLATLFYHPRVPAVAKKETISKLFKQELADFVHNFLLLLVDKRREAALPAIVSEYRKLANEARNMAEAEVITAMPLTEQEHAALVRKLSTVTGKNMVLKTQIDESILGGVIVKIGDKLIDGSVVRQLRMLKTKLLTTEVTKIGVTN
ncbi:MAG: F0F1 ATP synthase subunit delta [Pelosinus sp.]|nr:F0F1 ATP synthase subunit delta [Pelosinus sp.]